MPPLFFENRELMLEKMKLSWSILIRIKCQTETEGASEGNTCINFDPGPKFKKRPVGAETGRVGYI